jgi:large subunit ribosomal protein L3
MINTILGSKGVNSQTFLEGFRIPVTKVSAGPCVVTQIKNIDKDGYWAVQLGFGTRRVKVTPKPLQGHLQKITNDKSQVTNYPRYLREVRLDKEPEFKVGDIVSAADIFRPGDVISVMGVSKGKGFAGGMKRHGFHGGPKTHGQSDRARAPGSVGQTTTPGRVYRGKRMAGNMGFEQVTVKNLRIVSISPESGQMEISGQIPGNPGSLLVIHKIKAGSLKDLEHETVAQVTEGEAPTADTEKGTEEVKQEAKQEEIKSQEGAK